MDTISQNDAHALSSKGYRSDCITPPVVLPGTGYASSGVPLADDCFHFIGPPIPLTVEGILVSFGKPLLEGINAVMADIDRQVKHLEMLHDGLRQKLRQCYNQVQSLQTQIAVYHQEEAELACGQRDVTLANTLLIQYIDVLQRDGGWLTAYNF